MSVEELLRFPSLFCEQALEHKLFGASSQRLHDWLQKQLDFISDQDFARLFSDNIDCFDVETSAYNHRFIETDDGSMLGGIRFFGLDVERPFVEVIAHDFADMDKLKDVVCRHWRVFAPQSMRLTVKAHTLPTPDAVLDVSIHAAHYDQMNEPAGQLCLQKEIELPVLKKFVDMRYDALVDQQTALSRNISAASNEELQGCYDQQNLYVARLHAEVDLIGMIAVGERAIGWIDGEQVIEEVVDVTRSGRGYAAQMQMEMAALRKQDHPKCLLIGTIDRFNYASRKSAERAGRPEVLRRVFVPLSAA